MVFIVEAVCTGNNGRSPLVEAVAKRTLDILGVRDINFISSGTLVNSIDYSTDVKPWLRPYIEKAVQKGLFDKGVMERFERDPKSVVEDLTREEAEFREAYLTKSLGPGNYKHVPSKTIVRPDVDLILPVDISNLKRVKKLYEQAERIPQIETLGEFSGLGYSLEQDFPSTFKEYMHLASQVEVETRAAVLKILGR